MNSSARFVLAVVPLAAYLALLSTLLLGRRPIVLPGRVDFGLFAAGLGGLIVFGPIGGLAAEWIFPGPSGWAWASLTSGYVLVALLWSRRARRRLVVYGVRPSTLERAVVEGLDALPGTFAPMASGYEDRLRDRRVVVEAGWFGAGLVEGFGADSEAMIACLALAIRSRLGRD